MEPDTPAGLLRQGQALEARHTADSLAEAVHCYTRAIAFLSIPPIEKVRRELAIARMNFGNARQKQTDVTAATDAVRAYDDAIALLNPIESPDDFALTNTIGAAWMNRGHAFHRQGTTEALIAALDSHDRAVAQLQTLPLADNRSFRINLAAAWMNRAQALLSFKPSRAAAAHEAAIKSIQLTAEMAPTDPLIADIALRAHHALSSALSVQLATQATSELIAETGDIVDESLALVRHWEEKGIQNFRPIAIAIFRFGAQFYHAHQPQFLAEFILESVDPASSTGILFDSSELRAIAASALAQTKADAYNRSMFNPANSRLQQLRQDLDDAEKRLAELHSRDSKTSESKSVS